MPLYFWGTVVFAVLLVAAMFVRSQRANISLLALLAVAYPVVALTAIATGV